MAEVATRISEPRQTMMQPVLARLSSVEPCTPDLERRILALGPRLEMVAAKTVLQAEDAPVRRPRYLISGWACRFRHLSDGRRQIFDLVLPGDGVSVCLRSNPFANTSTMALTPLRLVDAAALIHGDDPDGELLAALQFLADADERRALNQIVRLGRMTALERLAQLFLELHERLRVIGQAEGARFACPLTQETLADVTGLSVVHVNRTLQELRRQGLVTMERGWVRLSDELLRSELADTAPRKIA